jgi:Ser/Thr protein kinase RdoA (MazF antagonist)
MNEQNTTGFWGDQVTQYFYELTPDRMIEAVEKAVGRRCTGQLSALNSMENRVYELHFEVEEDDDDEDRDGTWTENSRAPTIQPMTHHPRPARNESVIAKFYRPGRWSREQILEEHGFLWDLQENEIPAVAPLQFIDTPTTLGQLSHAPIFFALFPKVLGRAPDELLGEDAPIVGRLLARIHQVGRAKNAPHRPVLTPTSMGLKSLETLLSLKVIPDLWRQEYEDLVREMVEMMDPWFRDFAPIRIHGDCHLGNLIFGKWQTSVGKPSSTRSSAQERHFFFVDFDDMMMGPAIQDLWLLAPGRDGASQDILESLVSHYSSMTAFDRRSLKLIEPLRTLRMIHFSSWIARRWQDPSFQRVFETFGAQPYWAEQIKNLREQRQILLGV